jgi:hypothetical protein
MGGMHTWVWGIKHPDFMDALVPMASQPTEMSSRNWMMRRLIIDSIRAAAVKAAGNPVELVEAPYFNHFEILESLGNPYGPNGRSALALMKLSSA